MPRAILAYRLPQERVEFEHAAQADRWWGLVWDVMQELRAIKKYGRDGYDSETAAKLHEWLHGEMAARGLALDDG